MKNSARCLQGCYLSRQNTRSSECLSSFIYECDAVDTDPRPKGARQRPRRGKIRSGVENTTAQIHSLLDLYIKVLWKFCTSYFLSSLLINTGVPSPASSFPSLDVIRTQSTVCHVVWQWGHGCASADDGDELREFMHNTQMRKQVNNAPSAGLESGGELEHGKRHNISGVCFYFVYVFPKLSW